MVQRAGLRAKYPFLLRWMTVDEQVDTMERESVKNKATTRKKIVI
jgi:hypothetical protein